MSGIERDFDSLIDGLASDFENLFGGGRTTGGEDPFGGAIRGRGAATDPFSGAVARGANDPFGGSVGGGADPFGMTSGAPTFGLRDPFGRGNPLTDAFGYSSSFFADIARERATPKPNGGVVPYDPTRPLTPVPGGAGSGATGISGDPVWGRIDQYSGLIDKYGAEAGIDPDVFRAIMYNESGGVATAREPNLGASGLLQLMPSVWQGQGDPLDPETNLRLGAGLMREKVAGVKAAYAKNGITADDRTFARDLALAWAGHFNYSTGLPNPASRDAVFGQSADELSAIFLRNYDRLKQQRATQQPAAAPAGAGGPMGGLFGGASYDITQDFGPTGFSQGEGADIYDFGTQFGLDGDSHSGLDIGTPDSTKFFSPVAGTVIIAGGSGYYKDESGRRDPATSGEIRIRLDNGHELILGHNAQINVRQGQRINPGDFLGLTGTANGPHLHVEYRIPDRSTPSGWRIVDPRKYIRW